MPMTVIHLKITHLKSKPYLTGANELAMDFYYIYKAVPLHCQDMRENAKYVFVFLPYGNMVEMKYLSEIFGRNKMMIKANYD